MVGKSFTIINSGMNRDLSESKVGESAAWENVNIRILARDDGTALSVTNERGTQEITLAGATVQGNLIGWNVLNNHIILFTTDIMLEIPDRIYRIDKEGNIYTCTCLYSGILHFALSNPIESVVYYESENVQKIYWVDGNNVLRFMNFMADTVERNTWSGRPGIFDSNMAVVPSVSVTIEKDNTGNPRQNGVIQYFLTYYNTYGQETAFAWISDLVYLSPFGKGGEADGVNNNKVVLNIANLDIHFDRFKIYSVFRSALDGTVTAYLVADNRINDRENAQIIIRNTVVDDASHLTAVDVQQLLYLGSLPMLPGTLTFKDQTLFLGDLKSTKKDVGNLPSLISGRITQSTGKNTTDISFSNSVASKRILWPKMSVYPYTNELEYTSSKYKSFKSNEKYRFALKFGYADGSETEPFWFGDAEVGTTYPGISVISGETYLKPVSVVVTVPDSIITEAKNKKMTTVQLMMAEATYSDRSVLAQGIVNPTVFNVFDRNQGGLYAIPSWVTRPRNSSITYKHFNAIKSCNTSAGEIACCYWDGTSGARTESLANPYYTGAVPGSSLTYTSARTMVIYALTAHKGSNDLSGWRYDVAVLYVTAYYTNTGSELADGTRLDQFVIENIKEIIPSATLELHRTTTVNDAQQRFAIDLNYTKPVNMTPSSKAVARQHAYESVEWVFNTNLGIYNTAPFFPSVEEFEGYLDIADTVGEKVMINSSSSLSQSYDLSGSELARWFYALNGITLTTYTDDPTSVATQDRWCETSSGSYYGDDGVDATDAAQANFRRAMMYVDENIVTFNSPEIDYGAVYPDGADYKFRIVGAAPITSSMTDYTVNATMGHLSGQNLIKKDFTLSPTSMSALTPSQRRHGIIAWPIWKEHALKATSTKDSWINRTSSDFEWDSIRTTYYWLHMWERSGVITGYSNPAEVDSDTSDGAVSVTVDDNIERYSYMHRKVFANMYISYNTYYTIDPWENTPDTLRIFNSTSSKYTGIDVGNNVVYYDGVIDTLLFPDKSNKYPILHSTIDTARQTTNITELVDGLAADMLTEDPVRIQYATKPHAVLSLGTTISSSSVTQKLLPALYDADTYTVAGGTKYFPWKLGSTTIGTYSVSQDKAYGQQASWGEDLPSLVGSSSEYVLIGEIYKDFPVSDTRYGGITKDAAANCRYINCSPKVRIDNVSEGSTVTLYGTGDTYFQRYDSLRTVPFSGDSVNNVIDVCSVMLETHINIDGRSDNYRQTKELASIDVEKFGELNPVYSQNDNFRATRQLDVDYDEDSFRSYITWTLDKADMADVDAWSHITLANSLKLDPDYGICRSLNRYKNNLIAFQDKAISEILFNTRTLLSTDNGVPVELANSGKVNGKFYISNNIGCINKWSIVEGKKALYFIDNINKSFCALGLSNSGRMAVSELSHSLGFSAWFKQMNSIDPWTPTGSGSCVSFYDTTNSDMYIVRDLKSGEGDLGYYPTLVYNENLGKFTSFFNYGGVKMMVNIDDEFISYQGGSLWLQNKGLFCKFFGTQYGFSVIYRIAPEFQRDKIWSNIDYRADFYTTLNSDGTAAVVEHNLIDGGGVYDGENTEVPGIYKANETFSEFKVWNEYQHATTTVDDTALPLNPVKKFRIWRYTVPRADKNETTNKYGLDRIRNPWIYAKFSKNIESNSDKAQNLMQLHDMEIKYYE